MVVGRISRFSPEVRRRFDIVSFDPRGVGGSNPVTCSGDLLAERPSPALKSQADFDAIMAYNRRLRADCRARTGPVFDHLDTAQTVRDLDTLRAALGERKLTFHGSSYGTLLGAQYAETYPRRVRAMVLESVIDHSVPSTRDFLESEAATAEDLFREFVKWCDGAANCALHDRDVRAVWQGLLARAGRGKPVRICLEGGFCRNGDCDAQATHSRQWRLIAPFLPKREHEPAPRARAQARHPDPRRSAQLATAV